MNLLSIAKHGPASKQRSGLLELQTQVYQQTRSAERPLSGLMPWLVDRRNLDGAWERVRAAAGAQTPGLDGMTCAEVEKQLGPWLSRLAEELFRGEYRPQPPRWIDVPKPGRPVASRRIGILTIRDRVVQAALKQVLEPVLEPVFSTRSFGFRPGRSVAGALADVLQRLNRPADEPSAFRYGLQLDVADCFDTIDHDWLRARLAEHLADEDLNALLRLVVEAGGTWGGSLWWRRRRGVVQGSALSPLLCNLALHPLDQALDQLARETQDGIRAFRYADDLLLLGREPWLVRKGLSLIGTLMRRMRQALRHAGAVRPVEEGVEWLGVRIQPRPRDWGVPATFGYVVPGAKVTALIARLTEMTEPPSAKIENGAFNLDRWIVSINTQLRDWRQAYLFADNAPDVFRALDDHTRARVGALIQSITGIRGSDLYRQYRAHLPRGFWTWEVPGGRLVVLSSLAPHAPAFLTRRPPWMRGAAANQKTRPSVEAS